MANLYDFIGAKPGTAPEDIDRLILITRTRLQQTGQLYQEGNEQRLEEAHRILTDPLERAAYDARHGIAPQPPPGGQPSPAASPHSNQAAEPTPAVRRRRLVVLAILVAALVAVLGFLSLRHLQHWPTGIYLNSVVNGQRAAVFLERQANHAFPNGKTMTACKVRMLDDDEIRWMSERQMHAEFVKGPPAAPSDLK